MWVALPLPGVCREPNVNLFRLLRFHRAHQGGSTPGSAGRTKEAEETLVTSHTSAPHLTVPQESPRCNKQAGRTGLKWISS